MRGTEQSERETDKVGYTDMQAGSYARMQAGMYIDTQDNRVQKQIIRNMCTYTWTINNTYMYMDH